MSTPRTLKFKTAYLLLIAITSMILVSCGDDDDGVMERPDYTSINYKLAVSSDLLGFYNIKATYITVSGEEVTEIINTETWNKKDKLDGQHNTPFKFNVIATAKENLPNISGIDAYHFTCEFSAEYYTKATSAKREARVTLDKTVNKEVIEKYIQENDTISLVNYKRNN